MRKGHGVTFLGAIVVTLALLSPTGTANAESIADPFVGELDANGMMRDAGPWIYYDQVDPAWWNVW
ncbi:MAG TPA: hypothetical protein HPP83_08620, partial [Candidatus Hydrogenedentes bacterium]|nr:hypothetical protein [Candidatus Hydrogenedentota bacterium]